MASCEKEPVASYVDVLRLVTRSSPRVTSLRTSAKEAKERVAVVWICLFTELFFPLSTVLEIVRVHIYPRQINFSCHTLLEITFSPQLHFVILAGIFERRMFRGA